jgi:hypothetical protein
MRRGDVAMSRPIGHSHFPVGLDTAPSPLLIPPKSRSASIMNYCGTFKPVNIFILIIHFVLALLVI